jgi:WD40 repeat protein
MYLRVAFTVQPYEGWQFFEHTSFDFEKILRGWLAFSRRYKSHVEYQNRIGYIAYLQRDRALARRLTAALSDEQFREDVWGSEQAVTRFKAWVNTVMEARGAMRMFAADKVPLRCLVFSRNGKRLVVFGNVNYDAAFVWDIESSRLVRRMPAPPEPSRTNAISVDRRIAVWGGGDSTEDSTKLAVYRLSNGEVRATSSALTDGVRGLALTRKVDRLAVLQADRVITLWDPWEPEEEFASIELFDPALDATWIEKAKADPVQFHCHSLIFSGDDKKLLAVVQDREVRVFDVEAETLVQRWCEAHGTPAQAESLDRSPDGRFIAIGYDAKPPRPVDLIDAKTLEPLLQLKHESSVIYGLAFDDQGERIAIGGVGDGVTIWSTGTGKKLHGIPMAPTDTVTCLAFSPDGNTLAAGVAAHDKDGTVYIFDVSAYRAKAP